MEVIAGGDGLECRLSFDVSQNVTANTTTLLLARMDWRKAGQSIPYEAWCTGSVSVNGTVVKEFINTDAVGYPVSLTASWSGFACDGAPIGTHNGAVPVTVSHDADGSKRVKIAFSVRLISQSSYGLIGQVQQTVTVTLPTIPRVSGISASGVALGNQMTITLTRAASGFRDSLVWSCGDQSGAIATKSAETSFRWTPPVSLCAQNTQGVTVPVTLRVTTFSGSQTVGSRELAVTCRVPDSVVPSVSLTVSDGAGHASVCGGYVQDQSRARVVTAAAGVHGSAIRSISVRCGSLQGNGPDVSFALPSSGNIAISVTVKDSRGRSATASTAITVLAYSRPAAAIRQAYRCDASGQPQADGEFLHLLFDASVTGLTGNTASYQAVTIVHGGSGSRTAALTDYSGSFSVTNGSAVLPAGVDSGYDCLIRVTDRFQTCDSASVLVPVAFLLLDLDRDARAVGIGMRAARSRKLCVGLDMDMNEHRVGNLAPPETDGDAATKAYVDSRPAPNLLDNWYFLRPVNQRGASGTISTVGAFALDRWEVAAGSITISSAGLTFGSGAKLRQRLEYPIPGTKTVSCLYSDGTMGTGSYSEYTESSTTRGMVTFAASGKTMVAVKLEMGSQQTLCHWDGDRWVLNEVPIFSEQLARCQRFFVKYGASFEVSGLLTGSGLNYHAFLQLPVTMRAKPSLMNTPTATVVMAPNGYSNKFPSGGAAPASYAINHFTGNSLSLTFVVAERGDTNNSPIVVVINGGAELSADL